ncbi:MAG: MFS transporter [Deltaproteobacteria bacterium]|nr:MFS transporter [Deltaproteobacteria bacterium]
MGNLDQGLIPVESHKRAIAVVALGLWSASLTLGALRVMLPVYFASVGVSISKIALLFFFFKLSEIFAPAGLGLTLNRLGYRRSFIGALGLHSLLSCLYFLKPTFALIYLERFMRGVIGMQLVSSVYVKHFSRRDEQRFYINIMDGLKDAAKGIGMLIGGVLIAVLAFEHSILVFGLLTAATTAIALLYLPDLREEARTPVLKIWGAVDRKIKTLGAARGLLHGAMDGWGVAILPVYLTVVFGLSPALVGTVMMGEYVFHGVSVALLSRFLHVSWDSRKALIGCSLLLFPVCLSLALPMPIYLFLPLIFLYQFFNSGCMVYYNHLKLEFATEEKTSIDLATYATLTNAFKPVAVFASGLLAEAMGFSWAFYFSSLLILLSALTCLALPKPASQRAEVGRSYAGEAIGLNE